MRNYNNVTCNFSELVGKTLTKMDIGGDEINFTCSDGTKFVMLHHSDCCENVSIEDICGEVENMLNTPVLVAEKNSNDENPPGVAIPEYQDSFTWTFYNLRTVKGSMTIRWYGESNGYYSESVNFEKVVESEE